MVITGSVVSNVMESLTAIDTFPDASLYQTYIVFLPSPLLNANWKDWEDWKGSHLYRLSENAGPAYCQQIPLLILALRTHRITVQ